MGKNEFLDHLREGLSGLPAGDIEERLTFYGEMIDDRVEDGLTEEEAVREIGDVDEVAAQIIEETPISRLVIEKVRPKRRFRAWEAPALPETPGPQYRYTAARLPAPTSDAPETGRQRQALQAHGSPPDNASDR